MFNKHPILLLLLSTLICGFIATCLVYIDKNRKSDYVYGINKCPYEGNECPNVQAYINSQRRIHTDTATHTYETDDVKYYNGEILYPDYVHDDTLIVTDAAFLNQLMEKYDIASDGDISDALRVTTRPYTSK